MNQDLDQKLNAILEAFQAQLTWTRQILESQKVHQEVLEKLVDVITHHQDRLDEKPRWRMPPPSEN